MGELEWENSLLEKYMREGALLSSIEFEYALQIVRAASHCAQDLVSADASEPFFIANLEAAEWSISEYLQAAKSRLPEQIHLVDFHYLTVERALRYRIEESPKDPRQNVVKRMLDEGFALPGATELVVSSDAFEHCCALSYFLCDDAFVTVNAEPRT